MHLLTLKISSQDSESEHRGNLNSWLAGKSESYCSRWIYYIKDACPQGTKLGPRQRSLGEEPQNQSKHSKPHSNTAVYKKAKGAKMSPEG